jgi:hypothetical protein
VTEYIEAYHGKHIHPLAANNGIEDFPWEDVFARLDGPNDERASVARVEPNQDQTAANLAKFCKWILDVKARDGRGIKKIGIRFLASMWTINPRLFDGAPGHMVAQSYGLHPAKFRTYSAAFSREFKVQNEFQVHDWQRGAKKKGTQNEKLSS